jgi:5,10-methylenetetrahydrofolate reductase
MGARAQASGKRRARLVRQSAIENRQSKIPCAYLTVMDRNPEALEKALLNKS